MQSCKAEEFEQIEIKEVPLIGLNPEKQLNEKYKKKLQSFVEHHMKKEIWSINKKYDRYKKNLLKSPDYVKEWREFYMEHSHRLAACAVIDKGFYNYINVFNFCYTNKLDMQKKQEIELKRKDLEKSFNEKIKDVSDDESDLEIIEEETETYSISSRDDDEDVELPAAKKVKLESGKLSTSNNLQPQSLKGEKNTTENVKIELIQGTPYQFDLKKCVYAKFYDRPGKPYINRVKSFCDDYLSDSDPPLSEYDMLRQSRDKLNREVMLNDDDFIILHNKMNHLLEREQHMFMGLLNTLKLEEPYRYNILAEKFN